MGPENGVGSSSFTATQTLLYQDTGGFYAIATKPGEAYKVVGTLAGIFSLRELKLIRSCGDMQLAEMFVALLFLASNVDSLKKESALLCLDDLADVFVLNRWATKCKRLRAVLRCIAATCAMFDMNLKVAHIRSEKNIFADWLSRPEKHQFKFGGVCDAIVLSHQLRYDPANPFTSCPQIT